MSEISLAAPDKHAIGYSSSVQDTLARNTTRRDASVLSSEFFQLSFSFSLLNGARINFGRIARASATLIYGEDTTKSQK